MDPPEVLDSPHTLPSSPPTSNTQLAALLSDTFRDIDSLRKDLAFANKRAEKAERLVQTLTSDPSGSPSAHPNGNLQDQQQKHAQTVKKLIEEYDDRLAQAEMAREEAEARRRVAQEGWEQLERYLVLLESRAKDARIAFTRISEGSVAPLVLPLLPPIAGSSLSTYPPSSSMAPPNIPSRQHSRHQQSSRAFPALPPHPNPNLSPNAGTRRPRTPSMDGLYNVVQPPPKRSRTNTDEQRPREPRSSYSESYVGSMQQPQHLSSDSRDYPEQFMARARQQQLITRSQASRIIKYADPHQIPDPHGHSRSSSTSSLDVDEMLLRATTGDEHAGGANGGAPYVDSQHYLTIQRRRGDREDDPHSATNNTNGHPGHITTATNPYPPQHTANVSYPANQSAPVMNSLRAPAQTSQNQVIQTHIFAPVVTGAPTKKTKFPNTMQPGSGVGLPGAGPSVDSGLPSSTTASFASTNAQGQRICRQCGMVGRYKEGKCVEKWGPGPMGPGTVCDRCRKKMKRVERRGTLESQQQQVANQSSQQQQQHQPRSSSNLNLPLSQGSDRSIHRSDTILTHQPSNSPSSFSQSQSARDRDASSSHTQSNIRSSLSALDPSSSTSSTAPISAPHPPKHGPHQRPPLPHSPPPSIAALKEPRDDDDHHQDPDQLPISNIGRGGGGGSGAPSRSSSRNARVRGTGTRPTPPVTRSSDNGIPNKKSLLGSSLAITADGVESESPSIMMEVDEMDADADAEAEAEVESEGEAEILGAVAATSRNRMDGEEEGGDDGDADADADAELLEAVDAAEANSSSSGGERMRMKSES